MLSSVVGNGDFVVFDVVVIVVVLQGGLISLWGYSTARSKILSQTGVPASMRFMTS